MLSFASLTASFKEELKKQKIFSFKLDTVRREAVDTLKVKLITMPVFALSLCEGEISAENNACNTQAGCAPLQELGNKLFKTNRALVLPAMKRGNAVQYHTQERLAAVWAILQRRPYLVDTQFVSRTDHALLRWTMAIEDSTGHLAQC